MSSPIFDYTSEWLGDLVTRQTAEEDDVKAKKLWNKEGLAWIRKVRHDVTSKAREQARMSFPWIARTLAQYKEFALQRTLTDERLFLAGDCDFPADFLNTFSNRAAPADARSDVTHLGQISAFEELHAIAFTANPRLGEIYQAAAEANTSEHIRHLTSEEIKSSLGPVVPGPGIYAYSLGPYSPDKPFYVGRSNHVQRRLTDHVRRPDVNRHVRKADLSCSIKGTLVDLSQQSFRAGNLIDVPTSICSALETSLIACHGSTLGPSPAQ